MPTPSRELPKSSMVTGSGTGVGPSPANPVVQAASPQLAPVTKMCAAARNPSLFKASTSEAEAHVPLVSVTVKLPVENRSENPSLLFRVAFKTPNPETLPDPPELRVADGLMPPTVNVVAFTLTSIALTAPKAYVNAPVVSPVNVMVAAVVLVRLTSTCAYGAGKPTSAAFGTVMSKPMLSANTGVTPSKVQSSATANDAATASRRDVLNLRPPLGVAPLGARFEPSRTCAVSARRAMARRIIHSRTSCKKGKRLPRISIVGFTLGSYSGVSIGRQKFLDPYADQADLLALGVLSRVEEWLEQIAHLVLQLVEAREGRLAGSGPADREEPREAYGNGHGPKSLEPIGDEALEHGRGQRARSAQDEGGIEAVDLEGLLLSDRLALP